MENQPMTPKPDLRLSAEILVVDDAPVNLRILSQVLSEQGYHVRVAPDGARALEIARTAPLDLILLDIIMPEMDGYEVCQQLKADINTHDIPIIFLTALDQLDNKVKGFEVGGVDYITKPFQFPEVLARVQTHLALRFLQVQLIEANRDLEKRVQERTLELMEANRELENEIAERRRADQALRESEERYALAMQGSNDGLWDWDLISDCIYLSPRWKAILGYAAGEIGDTPDEWFNRVHADDLARFRMSILNHMESISAHLEEEYRMLHKDGTYRYVLTRGLAVRDANGVAYRMAGSQTDITYRRRIEEQLLHHAYYDSLTALPNRALFLERISNALDLVRSRQGYGCAVLTLDIDHFKSVNERLGHEMGDLLLAEVSWKLKSLMRSIDTIARIGEDEFGILLENVNSEEEVAQVVQQIRHAIAQPLALGGEEIQVSLRIGCALSELLTLPAEGGEAPSTPELRDQILRNASLAMQRARQSHKNGYVLFTPELRENGKTHS